MGNAIARSSRADFPLFSSTLSIIAPSAESSPAAQKLHRVCAKLYAITELLVAQGIPDNEEIRWRSSQSVEHSCNADMPSNSAELDEANVVCNLPMSQHDWDSVMEDFDLGLQNMNPGELAALVEPYMVP